MAKEIELNEPAAVLETKVPAHMTADYDWVESEVHSRWLANALPGRVVADALSRIPADSPEDHVVNVVRRAYYAHRTRPVKA